MADRAGGKAGFWRKLSKREQVLVMVAPACLLFWLLYQFPFLMQERRITSMQAELASAERNVLNLGSTVSDLKLRGSESKSVSTGWQLADQSSVILFLQDVSGEARRVGVNLVAVHPAKEIDKEKYKEVSLNLDLKGRYRELAEYFKRLESLPKVVNIRKVRLETCPDTASVCAAQVEAVTYMAK